MIHKLIDKQSKGNYTHITLTKMKDIQEIEESIVEALSYVSDKSELSSIEKEFDCTISMDTEKHNALQYTYYFDVDFGLDKNLVVEIESGINNGTVVNSVEWGDYVRDYSTTANVLKDIILDDYFYKEGSLLKMKAEAVLYANKSKLFEFHRKNNYDNYVTGGNSKMKMDELLSELHLKYIYEEIEVDRNFI